MLCRMVVLSVGLVMAGFVFAEFAAAGEARQAASSKPLRAGIIGSGYLARDGVHTALERARAQA